MLQIVVIIVVSIVCRAHVTDEQRQVAVTPVGRHTGVWAVRFKASRDKSYQQIAEEYAIEHDLINRGVIGELEDTYEFVLRGKHQGLLHKRELLKEYSNNLMNDHVDWFEHQEVLTRKTRTVIFNDPDYQLQWHLVCLGTRVTTCVYVCVVFVCPRACICVQLCLHLLHNVCMVYGMCGCGCLCTYMHARIRAMWE